MSFDQIAIACCLLLLAQLARDHLRLARACRRAESPPRMLPDRWPSVSIVRPTKGEDVEQFENFCAALATDYPGPIETLFVFEDADDPAHVHARRAIAEHEASGAHGSARIILAGPPPAGRTGKISNMIAGAAQAQGEFIGFGDSDTRPDPGLISSLVADLAVDPDAGAVFAPPVATAPPRTAGDVGYAVILNAYLGAAMAAFAGPERSLPFLMGQCMLFRRSALDAIGGIECADGQLVDDMFLGAQLRAAGWRNLLGRAPIAVINRDLPFGDFWRLWRRWLFFGRGGIPLAFMLPMAWRGLSVFVAWGLLLAAIMAGAAPAAGSACAVLLAEGTHDLRLNRLQGGAAVPPHLMPVAWLPQPLALAIALTMLFDPTVEWRGHTYRLDLAARLRPPASDGDGSA